MTMICLFSGPTHWHAVYPTCGGEKQSPVHIETHKVFVDHKLTAFEMDGYDQIKNLNMSLTNNGHTGNYIYTASLWDEFSKLIIPQ